MPLISITTKPRFHPTQQVGGGSVGKQMMVDFAQDLPALFVANSKKLRLDADTPEAAVQVAHHKFHQQDVNIPSVWVVVQFSESGLSKKQRKKVSRLVEDILLSWFGLNGYSTPKNFAIDCFWGPTHGVLHNGRNVIRW